MRRMGSPEQMALYTSQFDPSNPNGQILLGDNGWAAIVYSQCHTWTKNYVLRSEVVTTKYMRNQRNKT